MSEIQSLPGTLDITTYKGDTFSRTFTFTDANGDPLSLAAAEVTMQVRKNAGTIVLINLSEGNGITVSTNVVTIDFEVNIEKGSYKWDLQAAYSDGTIRTYVAGAFSVLNDITRP